MHILGEHLDMFDRCGREDAVTQIEDVPGPSARATQHVVRLLEHPRGGTQQQCWIQVSLNGVTRSDSSPRLIDRNEG